MLYHRVVVAAAAVVVVVVVVASSNPSLARLRLFAVWCGWYGGIHTNIRASQSVLYVRRTGAHAL